MPIQVGEQAPDFTLRDQHGVEFSLSSVLGKKAVLLVFYPFAFSGTCQGELCQLRDELATYEDENVQVLGVSVDSPFALKAWANQEGYQFPLLSDFWPHGAVAQSYGVFNEAVGMALRGTFLIDVSGVVRFAEVNAPGEARDQDAWKKAVASLKA